jgi:hypothetical protein
LVVLYKMLQLARLGLICLTVVVCVWIVVLHSPFRMYVKECEKEHTYYSKEMCMWMYMEMRKEESWLRRILLELGS